MLSGRLPGVAEPRPLDAEGTATVDDCFGSPDGNGVLAIDLDFRLRVLENRDVCVGPFPG